MKNKTVNEIRETISTAIIELKNIYNNPDSTITEMAEVIDYAKLLNVSDFVKTITD